MKRSLFLLLGAGILGASVAGEPAFAERYYKHGLACQPKFDTLHPENLVGYSEQGVINYSQTVNAEVFCPVEERKESLQDLQPDGVEVWVLDNSTTVPFACYIYTTDADGYSDWGDTKYACGLGLGCGANAPHTEETGISRIYFEGNNMPDLEYGAYGIWCRIPKAVGYARSYVKQINTLDPPY